MNVDSYLVETHLFRKIDGRIEFLLLKRADHETYSKVWQMVTGSTENNEKAYEAALREIEEETGLKPLKFWVVPNVNSFYSHQKDSISLVPVFVAQVNNDEEVVLSEEHSEYKWVEKDEAEDLLAWPGQRRSVEIIYNYFFKENSFINLIEIELDL